MRIASTSLGVVLILICAGCASSPRGDQSRFSEAMFWRNAGVHSEPSPDPLASVVRIGPGTSTILMLNQGWTPGTQSIVHASHHSVFMTLPEQIAAGQAYQASRAAGTLHYEGFSGSNFWYLDPEKTAWAKVEVQSITADVIHAVVQIEVTGVNGSKYLAPVDRPRHEISRKERIDFRLAPGGRSSADY